MTPHQILLADNETTTIITIGGIFFLLIVVLFLVVVLARYFRLWIQSVTTAQASVSSTCSA